MRVTYTTDDTTVASMVEYGRRPKKYKMKTTGESTSYRYFFYSSGKIHHVKIGPLKPNTIYYYRCGGHGNEFSFKTPPSTFPIEFAVAGNSPFINSLLFIFSLFFLLLRLERLRLGYMMSLWSGRYSSCL